MGLLDKARQVIEAEKNVKIAKEREGTIIRLKNQLKKIEEERLFTINEMKRLTAQRIPPAYKHTYLNIMQSIAIVSTKMDNMIRVIGDEKLKKVIHHAEGISDISDINPSFYKAYLQYKSELANLEKQQKFLEIKGDVDKIVPLRNYNGKLARLGTEAELVLRKLMKITL